MEAARLDEKTGDSSGSKGAMALPSRRNRSMGHPENKLLGETRVFPQNNHPLKWIEKDKPMIGYQPDVLSSPSMPNLSQKCVVEPGSKLLAQVR